MKGLSLSPSPGELGIKLGKSQIFKDLVNFGIVSPEIRFVDIELLKSFKSLAPRILPSTSRSKVKCWQSRK